MNFNELFTRFKMLYKECNISNNTNKYNERYFDHQYTCETSYKTCKIETFTTDSKFNKIITSNIILKLQFPYYVEWYTYFNRVDLNKFTQTNYYMNINDNYVYPILTNPYRTFF